MPELTISKVARQVGLQASAIRYFERIGLLPEQPATIAPSEASAAAFAKSRREMGVEMGTSKMSQRVTEHLVETRDAEFSGNVG